MSRAVDRRMMTRYELANELAEQDLRIAQAKTRTRRFLEAQIATRARMRKKLERALRRLEDVERMLDAAESEEG